MRLSWMAVAFGSTMGLTVSAQAVAQAQPYDPQPYETPRYSTDAPATLDKNFGLPTFGIPGADLPQQRTMATDPLAMEKPGFFKKPAEFALPQPREWRPGGTVMETPLFTTSEAPAPGYTTQMETGAFGSEAPKRR